ncbi:hypothetical protein [Cumulibacter soli]|uniref:hypothetical protein n=1 Tax=Cumulibacter soli TaxID=2546344 RepID=UPI001ABBE046|nr:hypothetical protein [Cumulibacter soli]
MPETVRCTWCSRKIIDAQPTGRRKKYCSHACRQRAYERRRLMSGTGVLQLEEDSVVVRRAELESLQDRLYVLRSAVEVLQAAVDDNANSAELVSVAREVVAATGDLDRLWISP